MQSNNIYIINFPNKALLVFLGQQSQSTFKIAVSYVQNGTQLMAGWVKFNNQTFYYNKTVNISVEISNVT